MFDTGGLGRNLKIFLVTAVKHSSQSLWCQIIFNIKVEWDGHFLRTINFGCIKRHRGTGRLLWFCC